METLSTESMQEHTLRNLIEIIESEYHGYFKYNIPIISTLLSSTLKFDSNGKQQLKILFGFFTEFRELLKQHTSKEKHILFPVIQETGFAKETEVKGHEFRKAYRILSQELTKLTTLLKKISLLTNNYQPEIKASPSLKQCYWDLKMLEDTCLRYFDLEKKYFLPKLFQNNPVETELLNTHL